MNGHDEGNLGIVRDIYGKWIWPFRRMEVGDYFYVEHERRDPENVRALAGVRAAQLGMRLSVEKSPPEAPKMCKVTRMPDERKAKLRMMFDYETLAHYLRDQYAIDAGSLPWSEDRIEVEAQRRNRQDYDWRTAIEARVADDRYGVELGEKRVYCEKLDESETLEAWQERRIADMMG